MMARAKSHAAADVFMKISFQALAVMAGLACALRAEPPTQDFISEQNVPIAMRDGVVLRADILRPNAAAGYLVRFGSLETGCESVHLFRGARLPAAGRA